MPRRLIILLLVSLVGMLGLFGLMTAQAQVTATPAPTETPAPTLPPTLTPLPSIPDGVMRGTIVRATVLNVRDTPFLAGKVLTSVRRGETYGIYGRNHDASWFLIQTAYGQGWVYGYYLSIDGNEYSPPVVTSYVIYPEPATSSTVTGRTTSVLKLHNEPSVNAIQTGRVDWGAILPVVGRTDGGHYLQVVWKGTLGWVYAPYVEIIVGEYDSLPIIPDNFGIPAASTPVPQVVVITATPGN
ncbi:MAG: SH3 domain-containing protein [Phototrophicaceae bacterium]